VTIFQHFLVPLDGSTMAEAALPVAVGLAKPLGARITLLHVQERSAPRTIHGERHLQDPESAEGYLAGIAERWKAEGVVIERHVHSAGEGDVARSIVDHASEIGTDLIVLTTHGWGGLRDLLFGSIAQQVLRRGTTPTLIVKPSASGQLEPYSCRSILVPLDGTRDAEVILAMARDIARATGARVMLASVVPTLATATGDLAVSATFSPAATSAVLDLSQSDASEYLESKAAGLRQEGVDVQTSVARGRTAQQLTMVADRDQVSLIVIATHGRSGLDGTFNGSVAQRLLGELRQPILLARIVSPD
jgi:nucleotide-binding universal stress UspA family protein